ncbi:hypothetical protein WISP_09600 [Willisornis vidua]|uniref:Rna-directed dna polymerase from mobile element jockey-like n=1 Tax=Willisornis vidua TaxID=1566151 RepID=A0ABQ9DWB3_9PASS|nr:hypothetical protein WISP_09600 [Willisornis vidua]
MGNNQYLIHLKNVMGFARVSKDQEIYLGLSSAWICAKPLTLSLMTFMSLNWRDMDLVTGPLSSEVDIGIKCIPSKFADDTKLCGAADMLKRRDGIQRDLDRPERCVCDKFMKFSNAKCKVLHLGWGNPKHK